MYGDDTSLCRKSCGKAVPGAAARQSQGSPVGGRGVAQSGIISGLLELAHEDGPTFIVGSH